MSVSGLNNIYGNGADRGIFCVKTLETRKKEEKIVFTEKKTETGGGQTEDRVEISPEGRLSAEQEQKMQETDYLAVEVQEGKDGLEVQDGEDTSEKQSGKVAVNVGKRARQIAAAKSRGQIQQVLALLQKDLADCKAGLEKGWCDESEIAKVDALMNSAKARLSEVPQESDQEKGGGGLDEFAMASLM